MGSWTTGGDLISGVYDHAGAGIRNAALSFGGENRVSGSTSLSVTAESYNGTVWSELDNALNTPRKNLSGTGVQSAAIGWGGTSAGGGETSSEEYNGTVWVAGGNLSSVVAGGAGAGIQSAAISFGGGTVSTEEYNGTTWSAGGDLGAAVTSNAGCGEQSAALSFGGISGIEQMATEEYNGTVWSAGGDLNNRIESHAGAGEQEAAISFGGVNGEVGQAITEEYNGTAWALGGELSVNRLSLAGAGTKTSGLAFGGYAYGANALVITEEYFIHYGSHLGITGIDNGTLFNGKALIGHKTNGKIYALDMDTYTEEGESIRRIRRTQIINRERMNVIHNRIEIEFEHGVGLEGGSAPLAELRWSDDEGNTWSDVRSVSIGEYQQWGTRAIWRRLGKSRNRIYELAIEAPVKIVLIGSYSDLKACRF